MWFRFNDPYGSSVYFWHDHPQERAYFYSDAAGTIPFDVTGLNFVLAANSYYGQYDNYNYSSTIPLSGTSYGIFEGHSYDDSFSDQYGAVSCDIQPNYGGKEILDGTSLTVPYTLI